MLFHHIRNKSEIPRKLCRLILVISSQNGAACRAPQQDSPSELIAGRVALIINEFEKNAIPIRIAEEQDL